MLHTPMPVALETSAMQLRTGLYPMPDGDYVDRRSIIRGHLRLVRFMPAPLNASTSPGEHDLALVAGMAGGDELAASALYDRHSAVMYGLALRIVDVDAGMPERATEFRDSFEVHVREARRSVMRKLFVPTRWGLGRGGFSWEH